MTRKPNRVLLLTPDAALIRAVSDTGLEAWTLCRAGTDTVPQGWGGIPPERILTGEDPARTLRNLAADAHADHGIDFVLCDDDAEPALLDVLRELLPPPQRTGAWPPARAELQKLLGEGPAPCPAPADGDLEPVCHVDTVSVGGMHLLLGIDWPDSPARFEEAHWGGVRETVRSALDLIGHESGGIRTSVALTLAGPRPVEMAGTPFLVASLGAGTTQ